MKKTLSVLGMIVLASLVVALLPAYSSDSRSFVLDPLSANETSLALPSAEPAPVGPVALPMKVAEAEEVPVVTESAVYVVPSPSAVVLRPASGGQDVIDMGKLVTWMTEPTCLLAGHDTMGWSWIDDIALGREVRVETGPCSGSYRVVGHEWQSVKGGPIPDWMGNYDAVLQTCTGSSGMGFSLLERA